MVARPRLDRDRMPTAALTAPTVGGTSTLTPPSLRESIQAATLTASVGRGSSERERKVLSRLTKSMPPRIAAHADETSREKLA